MDRIGEDLDDENSNEYIDNNKVYMKLKIGWKTSSLFSRISMLANHQTSFFKFSLIAMFICEFQYFFYIYNSSLMPKIPSSISLFFHFIVLKFNNPVYEIIFLLTLFICNAYLFICIFFDFLKPRDSLKEFPKHLEKIAAFISLLVYSIFIFPVLFSLFNFLECNRNDETTYFIQCLSTPHIIISLVSILCFMIIFIYSYIQYGLILNFIPTSNNNLSMNKYTGKEDYYEFIGKFILVLNEYVISEYLDLKIVEVGITTVIFLFITWRQLTKQPYYSNKCNNYKNVMTTGMTAASFVLFLSEIFKINDTSFILYIVLLVHVIFSFVGFFLGKRVIKLKLNIIYKNLKKKYSNIYDRYEAYTLNEKEDDDNQSDLSLDRIITDSYQVKKDYIFDNVEDCVLCCDFIRHNHELNSFLLAAKIFDECTIQYKKDPMSYIFYWLYLNAMVMHLKKNTELYEYEDCIKHIELYERIQNAILWKVIKLEHSYYTKYLVYYLLIVRTENSKDVLSDENEEARNDKNLNFHEQELKKHTLNLHIRTLNEINNTFKDLKKISSKDDVYTSVNNVKSLTKLIKETETSYKAYIQACYMSSDSLLLYNLFLENIMIDYYAASFYMKLIDENKEKKKKKSINRMSLMRQSRSKLISESTENLEVTKRKESLAAVKKEKKKQNENKERVLDRLQKPVFKFSLLIRALSIIEYLGMSIGYYYYKSTYSSLENSLNYILGSSEGPRLMNSITKDVRLLSLSTLAENDEVFNKTFSNLEQSKRYIDEEYIPLLFSVNTLYISDANIFNPLSENLYDDIMHQNYFQVSMDIQKDLSVILDKDYLLSQNDLLKNPYFRYFSENSKGSHEIIFLDSLDYIEQSITDVIDYQLYYVIIVISLAVLVFAIMILKSFIPMLNSINKSLFCVVQLFRDIPVETIDKMIHFHEKQTKYYLNNYSSIIVNNSDDEENMSIKKEIIKNKSIIDLYSFTSVTLLSGIFMVLPLLSVFVFRNHSLGELDLIFVSTKRTYYSQAIQTWAYEMFYMDLDTYRKGEPLAFISEAVDTLEDLEKSINKGSYGGKSVDKYDILKPLTQNEGCIRGTGKEYECDERIYDEDYTEKVANSPLDVIISEYITKTRDFIGSYNAEYNPLEHTKEDSQERLEKLFNNQYIIFHNKIINEINGHVRKMNEILVNDIISYISSTEDLIDFLHVISMIFIPLIYFIYFKNFSKSKLREMETLTIVFSNIPRSVSEKSTKIKLFVRHGTLESAF